MSQIPMTYQKGIKILNASRNAIADVPKKTFPKVLPRYSFFGSTYLLFKLRLGAHLLCTIYLYLAIRVAHR